MRAWLTAVGWLVMVAAGCTSKPAPNPGLTVQSGLTVVLQWDAPVDLDLYVTDPLGETAFFDNRALRSGLQLQRDARCAASGGMTSNAEIVAAEHPLPGRYRISVDFSDSCTSPNDRPVEFRVRARFGSGLEEVTGIGHFQRFNSAVLEVEIPEHEAGLKRLPPSRAPTTVLPQARRSNR